MDITFTVSDDELKALQWACDQENLIMCQIPTST